MLPPGKSVKYIINQIELLCECCVIAFNLRKITGFVNYFGCMQTWQEAWRRLTCTTQKEAEITSTTTYLCSSNTLRSLTLMTTALSIHGKLMAVHL
jgi:hypothetical protein